ncbi:MAG: M23 family metallopeptidase [Candidatus Nitrohelix vancouverensis]|uniref:M23 family metallopeptidase n=1 Tax=Candidatus Nitrohelix vancouverensis TaxID=2705534 RepID=A0A7T0G2X0_9BACT|nr:MAG: M23 family metallopeptidase [Candidatus Nitrohelix vancouverensis]
MHDFSTLNNQMVEAPRKKRLRTLFFLILFMSLGANVYFVYFQEPEIVAQETSAREEINPLISNQQETEVAHTVVKTAVISDEAEPNEPEELQIASFPRSMDSVDSTVFQVQTKIRNSLSYSVCKSISSKDECQPLAAHIARLLSWFFDVNRSMRNGDTLEALYEKPGDADSINVLKMTYKSRRFKKTFQAYFYKGPNMKYGAYFDETGKEIAHRLNDDHAPIRDYMEITSLPGDFRSGSRGHSGTDFKAEVGTPVFSSFDGVVKRTQWNIRNNGYCIEVDHPTKGLMTRYLHMSRVLVKPGQRVKRGDKIGESGNTGRTFAPHLHYEVLTRSKARKILNPFESKHFTSYQRRLSDADMSSFEQWVQTFSELRQG